MIPVSSWGRLSAEAHAVVAIAERVIGLSIGYVVKYHLDKRYVFKSAP